MLTSAMKEAIERVEVFSLATASSDGIPNVVPIRCLGVASDDSLWIMDNYLLKTLANLAENPKAAVFVWSPEPKICFQVKGDVEIHPSGADYERIKAKLHETRPDLPARALLLLRIAEIYECLPGENAGKRIA